MQCVSPVRISRNLDPSVYPDGLEVPCGKCIGCRIARRKEWTMRCLHELSDHEDSIFVTLTYDDDHVPEYMSLCKSDLQKFFKRLRKRLGDRHIRYFACGEYGDNTYRPHYHAIIFGLSLLDTQCVKDSWFQGLIHFGLAEPDSIRYVAQYIDKKFTGDLAEVEYVNKNREPVFKVSSLGIGRNYVIAHSDQLIGRGCVTVNGVNHALPRYYCDLLGVVSSSFAEYAMELDCDVVENYTGVRLTSDEAYRQLKTNDVVKLNECKKAARAQHETNLIARVNLNKSKL